MKYFFLILMVESMMLSTMSLLPVLIYPGKRTDSTKTSVTKFISIPSTKFVDLSFCFWVKVNHLVGAKILHYELNDTQGFGFTLQEEYGFVNLKTVDLLFDYHSPHIPDRWRHFCVVYDSVVEGVTVYMDGIVTFEKVNVTGLVGSKFHENLLQYVSIGKGGESFSQQLNGEFSKLMVWNKVLGRDEVKREWECVKGESNGLVLDWNTVKMERGDTVMMIKKNVNCPTSLGREKSEVIGFGQRVKFDAASSACLALGGEQVVPLGEEEVVRISERFQDFKKDCDNKFWVPVRQQGGRWVHSSSLLEASADVPYLPWRPGQPNGGSHQACVEAKFDKLNGSFQGYNDLNCAKSIRCFFCKVSTLQTFYLRGMCKEASMDTKFVGGVDTQQKNRPYWKGYRSAEISFSPSSSSWQMTDITTEQVVATYNGSSWPVGLHTWQLGAGVCSRKAGKSSLMLSRCGPTELSCGDGTCLPLSAKCDSVTDCKDQLDEKECRVVEFPAKRQYQEMIPPVGRKIGGGIMPVKVRVGIDVVSITNIKESSMMWGCKFQLNLTWVEDRVLWRDLRDNTNLNMISQDGPGKGLGGQNWSEVQDSNQPAIWVPVLIFTNTANSDHTIMDSKSSLTVKKVSNYTKSTLDQLEEVAYYEGKENPVTFRRMYKKEFSCNFQLYFYPFDSQTCSILLSPPSHLAGLVELAKEDLVYSGPMQMLQYNIINWKIEEVDDGLMVVFKMQRRIQHHLFTTFIPTFCLMLMCQSTLYFKSEHFKTTAGVTVTTMLVMYTLYQSVSHKLVPTAYIKMIDIWLIFGLILPFCVFFLLVMIDHLPSLRHGDTNPSKLSLVREVMVKIAHYVLPTVILLFACSYSVAAATIYNTQ